ncbi:translocation/assembly module TamB domain-containing protein [Veillonella tobetsuensis]|uniref:hypothetical protein n=1 Tax=Veillonella tobetsuensis TaxID=1110546 RepID=UPI0007519E54|nr:hypothetical protein [Veillonella tobetsuensis]
MTRRIRSYWSKYIQLYKRGILGIITFIGITVIIISILATVASRGMGVIFNEVIARQTMMKGSVTVASLTATPWGTISFEDLQWNDEEGHQLMSVPSGKIRVNMWDVITRNFKASAIRGIELNDAVIVVDLDDDNRVDFVPASPDVNKPLTEVAQWPKAPKKTTLERQEELGKKVRNFNWNGQHIDAIVKLSNCQLEIFQKNRHYVMNDVNARFDIDTKSAIRVDMKTGKFGGTAIGDGLTLEGRIDLKDVLKDRMPTLNMNLNIYGVDPASLGFGDSIHDKMTLLTRVNDDFNRPFASGRVTMPILKIPALTFENVVGDVMYQDGILKFQDVYANVFGGKLKAEGIYNLDTRAYELTGVATDVDSSIALKIPDFAVPVSANLNFSSKGQPKDMVVWGDFTSGAGRYILIPIQSITGRFHNQGRHLSFADVKVHTSISTISTNALHIDNGELTLGPLNITSNGGSNFAIYDEDAFDELGNTMNRIKNDMTQVGQNMKRVTDNTKSIHQVELRPPSDTKDVLNDAKESINGISDSLKVIKIR